MGLPNPFSKKLAKKNNLFILSLLTDESMHSSLWQVYDEKIILISRSKVRYYQTPDEQLLQMDESLQDLGERSEETDEVLFAFEPSWIEKNKVSATHERELKKITDSLSLKPLGFVSATEAVFQHLLKINNFLSSIVLYIGAKNLDLTVVRQGKITGSLSVGRSEDISSDLQEALARLEQNFASNGTKLPPNIVLCSAVVDSEKLSLFQQQLFSLNWTEDFNFVQKPVIEVISSDQLLDIVTKYYGEAVAKQKGLISTDSIDPSTQAIPSQPVSALSFTNSAPSASDKQDKLDQDEPTSAESQQASFGVPISPSALEWQKQQEEDMPKSSDIKDIQDEPSSSAQNMSNDLAKPLFPPSSDLEKDASSQVKIKSGQSKPKKKISVKLIIFLSIFLGLLVAVAASYFLVKMNYQVEIQVTPKIQQLNKNTVITLDASLAQSDPENNLLKAEIIQEEVSDKDTIQTTGVKTVGEKATGEIMIFNKTSEDKTFAQGTRFRTKEDDLEFELDEEVIIPGASTEETDDGESEIREFGKKEATLVAKEIGVEGNIDNKSEFKIADFSENTYSARAAEDFSGGLSREIRVVADADHEELMTNLRQRLLKQARDKLQERSAQDRYIIPTEDYKVTAQQYSDEVAEEMDNVSLEMTLVVYGLSYTNQDLRSLAKNVLQSEIPDNFLFEEDDLDVISKIISDEEDELIQIEAEISGKAKAEIDDRDLVDQFLGLPMQEVEQSLKEQDTVSQVRFVYTPFFAGQIFRSLPDDSSRIMIKIDE